MENLRLKVRKSCYRLESVFETGSWSIILISIREQCQKRNKISQIF